MQMRMPALHQFMLSLQRNVAYFAQALRQSVDFTRAAIGRLHIHPLRLDALLSSMQPSLERINEGFVTAERRQAGLGALTASSLGPQPKRPQSGECVSHAWKSRPVSRAPRINAFLAPLNALISVKDATPDYAHHLGMKSSRDDSIVRATLWQTLTAVPRGPMFSPVPYGRGAGPRRFLPPRTGSRARASGR